jgi:multiple sugar transport system ATP-binding protein
MAKVALTQVPIPRREKQDRAVHLLDLEIPDRQFFVLAGPEGSGKSTVLRLIAGLTKTFSGQISIDGQRVNEIAPKDRPVAMVFGRESLYPNMTAHENIAFALKRGRSGRTEIKKRIAEAADILDIADLLERRARTLSFAQQQRIAIARALVRQPKVFLFDRVLENLDANSGAELRREIIKLCERLQTTTIFATRDDHVAISMADTIALFDAGTLQAVGTPRALYEKPENMITATFLGHPPINLIRGELKLDRGVLRFHEAEGGTMNLDLSKQKHFDIAISFVGKPLLLGVRPEEIDVSHVSSSGDSAASFRAIAELIQPFGAGSDIYFQTGAHAGICRSRGFFDRNEAGHRMEFVINMEKANLFDTTNGKRIV